MGGAAKGLDAPWRSIFAQPSRVPRSHQIPGCMGLLCRFSIFLLRRHLFTPGERPHQPRHRRRPGRAQIADDLAHPRRAQAVLPRIAIATRRPAAPAAMHAAAMTAMDGGRPARRTGPGARAAARGGGEDAGFAGKGLSFGHALHPIGRERTTPEKAYQRKPVPHGYPARADRFA